MCGFAGMVHWNGEPVDSDELKQMVVCLRHRGPDELRTAQPESPIGLAHARLKVIDLSSAARQPMTNEDQTLWLVYNGEVYNYRTLRAELETGGCRFRSQSDTEVILLAYERWGVEAIPRLDGMFAFVLWDSRRRELLLARDRTGKKPLFYWTDGRCLTFGSEIKALLAHPHVLNEVNESALPHLLAFGYPPTGQTCYRQIRQVPPASFLKVSLEKPDPQPESYWDLDLTPRRSNHPAAETVQELRRLMREAVRRRLVADVPLGAFLSGGIDSTIVVGLMSELTPGQPVKTFSIGFEGDRRFNETQYAKIAADYFHTQHKTYVVTPPSFDLLERLVWHHDQPFGDSSSIPLTLLAQWARGEVTVALTGDGGDELFAGYLRFRAALWAERTPRALLALGQFLLRPIPAGNSRSLGTQAKRFLEAARLPLLERYCRWTAYRNGDQLSALSPSWSELWTQSARWSVLSRLLYLNFKEYLPNDLLVKADRCTMAVGLETRSPFLDTALIEYVAGLPDSFKATGWDDKILLKKAFSSLLPPPIRSRRKMGFGVPLGSWFRKKWRQPLEDLLLSSRPRIARYLDPADTRRLIEKHLGGTQDAGHQLWLLLTLEIWLRQREQMTIPNVSSLAC